MSNRLFFLAIIFAAVAVLGFSCGGDSTGPNNDDNPNGNNGGDSVIDLSGTWTLRTSGTGANLRSIAYSGNHFVAVGDSGVVLTSSDGTIWSRSNVSGVEYFEKVIWTGTQFMAAGRTLSSVVAILSYAPGASFSLKTVGVGGYGGYSISKAASGRLLVCAGPKLLWSNDAVNWDVRDAMQPNGNGQPYLYEVWDTPLGTYAYGRWTQFNYAYWFKMGIGYFDSSSAQLPRGSELVWTGTYIYTNSWWYTSDGITWVQDAGTGGVGVAGMIWTGKLIVGAGYGGYVAWKETGGTWSTKNVGVTNDLNDIAFSGSRYVVVGRGGVILTRP
jgi:hypothetical protein